MNWSFAIKNFLLFSVFTAIGTLAHELGHFFIARLLGYKVGIAYGSTYYYGYGWEQAGWLSSLPLSYHQLLTISGGVFSTVFIGTLGMVLCYRNRHYKRFSPKIHAFVLMALFWGREVFILAGTVFYFLNGGFVNPRNDDESRLAALLHLPYGTVAGVLGGIGILVCVYVFFFIRKPLRLSFSLSAALGFGFGFFLWFHLLGPLLLPVGG